MKDKNKKLGFFERLRKAFQLHNDFEEVQKYVEESEKEEED